MHEERLNITYSDFQLHEIERNFQKLKAAYANHEGGIKTLLDSCNFNTPFHESWEVLGKDYQLLRDFFSGFASIFPDTSTIESDYSIMGWGKDKYRISLTDLSLEGILHSKQFTMLHSIIK